MLIKLSISLVKKRRRMVGVTGMMVWLVLFSGAASSVAFGEPGWVKALRGTQVPEFDPETAAVCLLVAGRTEVKKSGEIKSYHRVAYKILTREGVALAWLRLSYDAKTKVFNLKAWNLKSKKVVHETKAKDAVETQLGGSGGVLYQDVKSLLLFIPQVEVGSIIAYEYERRHRPSILQDLWTFQLQYPVLRSRFQLQLPDNWEFHHQILQIAEFPPRSIRKNEWVWELANLPPIPEEEGMPPVVNLSAQLLVSYFPSGGPRKGRGKTLSDWDDFARWTNHLMATRFTPSAEITETARRLETTMALAEFVQRDIRYVAIEIGIGGYQPHFAGETFSNRYGDCKDKVTLLRSLMKALDREIYPVLIHTGRRALVPDFPSPLYFNHMIAAIPVSEEEQETPAMLQHPELGRLLLFDPTNPDTPFGQLPSSVQGTTAMLIRGDTGILIETPVSAAAHNRLLQTGNFQLSADGMLTGQLSELYWGELAARETRWLEGQTHTQWIRGAERAISRGLPGAQVKKFSVSQLDQDNHVREEYVIEVPHFAETAGDRLMFRPGLLAGQDSPFFPKQTRKFAYRFSHTSVRSSVFSLRLPEGYMVEHLPASQEKDFPFGRYRLQFTVEGNVLKYVSLYEVKGLIAAVDEMPDLREFSEFVKRGVGSVVLLKRTSP